MRPRRFLNSLSYLFLFICGAFVMVPYLARNVLFFLCLVLVSFLMALLSMRSQRRWLDGIGYVYLFSALGLFYAFLSSVLGNWTAGYDFSSKYIFRHSYFLVMMPIFVLASIVFFSQASFSINELIRKYGHWMLMSILLFDFGLAYAFGSREFEFYNSYTFFMDKGLLWLFVSYITLFSVFNCDFNVKSKVVGVFVINAFLQNVFGFGTMFTAATGQIIFLVTLLLYFAVFLGLSRKVIGFFVIGAFWAVVCFVFVAPFYSSYFMDDLNTYWRLESWMDNILAVFSNNLFGAGFGVSYFSLSQDVIDSAYKAYLLNESRSDFLDQVFIRGQHSSLINVFFRMGAVGLVLFLLIIIVLMRKLCNLKYDSEYFFLMPLLFFAFLNISTHVGLENPPFFISFCVTLGASIFATGVNLRARHK